MGQKIFKTSHLLRAWVAIEAGHLRPRVTLVHAPLSHCVGQCDQCDNSVVVTTPSTLKDSRSKSHKKVSGKSMLRSPSKLWQIWQSKTRTKELWLWDELACLMCVYRITSCSGLNISNSVKSGSKLAWGSFANFSFNLLVFTKSDLINRKGSSKEKMPIFSSVFCNRWIFPSSHPWCQFGKNIFSGLLLLPRLMENAVCWP